MTNVPDRIREAWKDIYVLFDTHYSMDCSSPEAWNQYWAKACEIWNKYREDLDLAYILDDIGGLLLKLYNKRVEADNRNPTWKPGEEYPHPIEIPERVRKV